MEKKSAAEAYLYVIETHVYCIRVPNRYASAKYKIVVHTHTHTEEKKKPYSTVYVRDARATNGFENLPGRCDGVWHTRAASPRVQS